MREDFVVNTVEELVQWMHARQQEILEAVSRGSALDISRVAWVKLHILGPPLTRLRRLRLVGSQAQPLRHSPALCTVDSSHEEPFAPVDVQFRRESDSSRSVDPHLD